MKKETEPQSSIVSIIRAWIRVLDDRFLGSYAAYLIIQEAPASWNTGLLGTLGFVMMFLTVSIICSIVMALTTYVSLIVPIILIVLALVVLQIIIGLTLVRPNE